MPKPKSRGNGTGSVYKLPNGKYRAAATLGYTEEGRRIYKTKSGFKTKKEGLEYLAQLRDNADKPREIKFSRLYELWSAEHFPKVSKNRRIAFRIAFAKLADIHYMPVSDIRLKDIQPLVDKSSGNYSPKHDMKVLCNQIFKYAMKNDYISKNYAEFITLPPEPKSTRTSFTRKEIELLWRDHKAGNGFTAYILVMIYTGMRFGELQALKKENVFLEKNYMIGGIKTDAGIDRQIMIPEKIKPLIGQLYENGKTKLLHMNEDNFYKQYYESLERAGVSRKTPHCCRHTFATLMAESGIQPGIITEIAGHENYQTTLQYTHISLEEKLKAVNKL